MIAVLPQPVSGIIKSFDFNACRCTSTFIYQHVLDIDGHLPPFETSTARMQYTARDLLAQSMQLRNVRAHQFHPSFIRSAPVLGGARDSGRNTGQPKINQLFTDMSAGKVPTKLARERGSCQSNLVNHD